jgi:hypothetical protein
VTSFPTAFETTLQAEADDDSGARAPCDALVGMRTFTQVFRRLQVPGWYAPEVDKDATSAKQQALAHWTKTPTKPWLIAALTAAAGDEPEVPALLAAARAIDPAEVAGPTVALHEVRLLRLSGRRDDARARLAQLPTQKWSLSAQNFFELERFLLADTAVEAMQHLWPTPVSLLNDAVVVYPGSTRIDETLAVRVASASLDAATMVQLSSTTTLPLHVRQSLAWSALVRHALLGGDVKSAAIAVLAVEKSVEVAAVRDASDDVTARGLALRAVMVHAGASAQLVFVSDRAAGAIGATGYERYGCDDTMRNGWFPTNEQKFQAGSRPLVVPQAPWSTSSAAEQAMIAAGSGSGYARAAVAFAQANPTHALSPELLHLAVRHSLYMSGGADTKTAFRLLHQRWPKTLWAEKTPVYW